MLERFKTALTLGDIAGLLAVIYTFVEALTLFLIEIIWPAS
jgi:hypothetical protein